MSFKVIGTGSYLPPRVLTNNDLANMVDTSDEWITQRVGIKERHISTEESSADMAYKAALNALEMSGTQAEELDLIIAASISSDTLCPTVAGVVGARLGAKCMAFDVNSACSGFMFALDTAAGFFERGNVRKALVIGAERMSKLVDWSDRNICVIFGDGAGAAVLEKGDGYAASRLMTCGEDTVIKIPTGTNNSPFYKKEMDSNRIHMDGQETFKFAVNAISEGISEVARIAEVNIDDIQYIVPHQANVRIIQYASKRLNVPIEKFFVNIERCGNTSAASVAIALDELNRSGKLKDGDIIAMTAFGGGLSSAACIIKW